MKTKFYRCAVCGNVIVKTVDSGVKVHCCGQAMEELIPYTEDAGKEKHVPVVNKLDDCTIEVLVGGVEHPMLPAHFIQFIYVETENGGQIVHLKPEEKPRAVFCCCKSKPVAVYEYCNLHGLWKTEL